MCWFTFAFAWFSCWYSGGKHFTTYISNYRKCTLMTQCHVLSKYFLILHKNALLHAKTLTWNLSKKVYGGNFSISVFQLRSCDVKLNKVIQSKDFTQRLRNICKPTMISEPQKQNIRMRPRSILRRMLELNCNVLLLWSAACWQSYFFPCSMFSILRSSIIH